MARTRRGHGLSPLPALLLLISLAAAAAFQARPPPMIPAAGSPAALRTAALRRRVAPHALALPIAPARRHAAPALLALRAQASPKPGGDGEASASASKSSSKGGKAAGLPVKQLVLALLVVQNACQMLSMRYSRVALSASAVTYLPSTAVVAAEVLKVLVCLLLLVYKFKGSVPKILWEEVIVNWQDTLKVAVPAFVYMVQNNLLYIATSNLDAATCQITYQLKILTTAMFAVGMLGKTIKPVKWLSLVILVAGIALVQLPQMTVKAVVTVGNPAIGFAAVVSACVLSGFAGIWFEKILKGSDTSIWIRNVQLGVIGGLLGLAGAFWKDGAAIQAAGFFQGYTPMVWSVVAQVGCGGLLVALVVRYADNILKGFATSLSIIASGVLSMYFIPSLKFTPTPIWFAGTTLVMLATVMYSLPDKAQPAQISPPKEE